MGRQRVGRQDTVPGFSSRDFGHVTPNVPLAIGAEAEIKHDRLLWNLEL